MTQPAAITSHTSARPQGGPESVLWAGMRIVMELPIALYGLCMCAYLLARVTIGEESHAIAFANNLVPWWALGGLGCVALALFMRHRWLLVALQLPILAAFAVLYGHQFCPHSYAHEVPGGHELTVITFNMESSNTNVRAAAQMLIDVDADVVGLQEIKTAHVDELITAISPTYPYQYIYDSGRASTLGLFSRYPIIDRAAYHPKRGFARHLRTVLDVDGTAIIVYVAHPDPPHKFLSPVNYDDSTRDEQIATMRDSIAADNGPLLMLCDCNMTDQSDAYRAMDRLLNDTFREVGWGLGLTFPARSNEYFVGLFPIMRLEYVWHNTFFVPLDIRVHPDTGSSDHHPVVARQVLKQGLSLG